MPIKCILVVTADILPHPGCVQDILFPGTRKPQLIRLLFMSEKENKTEKSDPTDQHDSTLKHEPETSASSEFQKIISFTGGSIGEIVI